MNIIAGNVGIGTETPGAKLHIVGGHQTLISRGAGNMFIEHWLDGNDALMMWGDNDGARADLRLGSAVNENASGFQEFVRIKSNGNVGIGTPSPAAKLDVNGNAIIRGDKIGIGGSGIFQLFGGSGQPPFLQLRAADNYTVLTPAGAAGGVGGFRVTDWENKRNNLVLSDYGYLWVKESPVLYSDSKIKLDQRELDYGLEQVMALKPKRYNRTEWTQDMKTGKIIVHPEKKKNDIGLVAQDIQEIIPEAVVVPEEEGEDKLLGIAYPKLIPVLIKAIQDQQKQIEKLEDKIMRLEKKTGNQVK